MVFHVYLKYFQESADGTYLIAAGIRQPGTSATTYNGYVVKLDAATGSKIWEFDFNTNAGTRSGFETVHFTADGGFIVGGFTDRAGTNFPGFKSGGQIDEGRPVLHKFSAALANASSASNNPTPEWSYNCGPANSVCKMEDGSIKNMRVYMDGGKDLRFFV